MTLTTEHSAEQIVTDEAPPDRSQPRRLIATGFAAVDVTFGDTAAASAGGTAVNVARAARQLGWEVDVVGTIGVDPAGALLRSVLAAEGVGTDNFVEDSRWTTPVVLQEQHGDDHIWRFRCPVCGTRFAKHRPSSVAIASQLISLMPAPDVLFFDRTSLFALGLARAWRALGTFVVFEPAMLGRPHLFDQAVATADLVKFSTERAPQFIDRLPASSALIVETLGGEGARFAMNPNSSWSHVEGKRVQHVVDSAGAGDWTTAGLITELIDGRPRRPFQSERVRVAVRRAQVLGAAACGWSGVFPQRDFAFDRDEFEMFACPRVAGRFLNGADPGNKLDAVG